VSLGSTGVGSIWKHLSQLHDKLKEVLDFQGRVYKIVDVFEAIGLLDELRRRLTFFPSSLDPQEWSRFLREVELIAVELTLFKCPNVDSSVGSLSLDLEILKNYKKYRDIIRLYERVFNGDNIVRSKLCSLLSKREAFERFMELLRVIRELYNSIYEGVGDDIRDRCWSQLVESVANQIKVLDVGSLTGNVMRSQLKLDDLEKLAKRGVKYTLLSELMVSLGELERRLERRTLRFLVSLVNIHVSSLRNLVEDCSCISKTDYVSRHLDQAINGINRYLEFLSLVSKRRGLTGVVQKLASIKVASLEDLRKVLNVVKTLDLDVEREFDEVLEAIFKNMIGLEANLVDVYRMLKSEGKLDHLVYVIRLCEEGVLKCTVSLLS
jgi:hypothetical protein